MDKTSKLLGIFSFLIIVSGLGFLFFSLSPKPKHSPPPQPQPAIVEVKPVATTSAVVGIEGERVLVTQVIDGDTIEIEDGRIIRLIGIDTPETVDPRKPVQCFGKEAGNETKRLLSGKVVILQQDISETDKYKRFLRYVYLPLDPPTGSGQILFVNDYLVREGFARVLTYPPDIRYNEQLRQGETEAREQKRGLWGRC